MATVKWMLALYAEHGTKILGTAAAIIASLLVIEGLIPADQVKWWQAANAVLGVLTVRRGFTNSRAPDDTDQAGA